MHLLLVEDDLDLGTALQRSLNAQGHACTWVRSIRDARAHTGERMEDFDCVVLDLGLPDGQGLDLLGHWRSSQRNFPVIVLTARDAVASRIAGLDAGADDYVIKPVTPEELASRIRAVTRRAAGQASAIWDFGRLRINMGRREISIEGKPVALHFHAGWCGTCTEQERVLNKMKADKALPTVTLLVVDYDANKPLRKQLKVTSQSVFVVYKGRNEVARSGGETRPEVIRELLSKAL